MVTDARTTTATGGAFAGMVEKWRAAWRMVGGACSSVDRGGDGKAVTCGGRLKEKQTCAPTWKGKEVGGNLVLSVAT